jgi:hypothetical protein
MASPPELPPVMFLIFLLPLALLFGPLLPRSLLLPAL